MYICENCKHKHDGKYGSGRFCSKKCARGFSTKAKRKEINELVRKKLTKDKIFIEHHCEMCGNIFKTSVESKRKYCKNCTYKSPEYRDNASKIRITNILNGKIEKFGKSKKCNYCFNGNFIRCDSKLEYCALKYMDEQYKLLSIERCPIFILYDDFLGIKRKFIPDFLIKLEDKSIIMECKYEKINYQLNEKWTHYLENIPLKKNALKSYCVENGFEMIWFTDKTEDQYKKIKHLKDFKNEGSIPSIATKI